MVKILILNQILKKKKLIVNKISSFRVTPMSTSQVRSSDAYVLFYERAGLWGRTVDREAPWAEDTTQCCFLWPVMQNEHRFLLAIGRSAHNALSHSTTVLKRSSRLCVFVCECQGGSSSGNNPSGFSLCTATKLSSRRAFLLIKNASIQKPCFTWYLFWNFLHAFLSMCPPC